MNQDKAEAAVERLVRRIEEVNGKFLEMMGARIKDVGEMSVTDAHRLIGMREYGADVDELTRELARITDKNTDEIHELYEAMAKQDYDFAERFYQARGKTHIPFEENETLRRFVDTVAETTAATYRNMSRSTAFQIPDGKGGMKLSSLAEVYNEVMDKAVTAVTMGHNDYFSEMRDVMTALADSGIRTVYTEGRGGLAADYASGYSRRLDTAVRQNLLWGVKQCAVGTQERIAADIGADGYEVDYHRNPRPSHAPMGGMMFAIGEAREVNGKWYESFEEKALPFLEEYGCLHFATAVVLGVSEPRYDEEELAKWKAEDAKTFTFEGKEYNGYEATQAQRKLEARIRNRKDRVKMAESAGDVEKARVEQMRLNQTVQKYGEFSKAAGLRTKYERMYVAGYRPMNVGRLTKAETKDIINKKISSGEYSTKLSVQQCDKHIEGTAQFEAYKTSRLEKGGNPQSILTITPEKAQEIILQKHGTGNLHLAKNGKIKDSEMIVCDEIIGKYYGGGSLTYIVCS